MSKIMQLTSRHAERLQGKNLLELMTGETPYISDFLDFVWYDRVWFKEDAGLGETQIISFLGPLHKVVSLIVYWILPASGIPVLRKTVQCVTYLETCDDASKQCLEVYDKAIKDRFHEKYTEESFTGPNRNKPTVEMWTKQAEDEENFQSGLNKVFYKPAVKISDEEINPDLYDNYVNMELILD